MEGFKISSADAIILGEFLRRYVCFHEGEDMHSIRLWGLFDWGGISKMVSSGKVLTDYTKENVTCWCVPSTAIIDQILAPAYQDYLASTEKPEDKFGYGGYDKYIQPYRYDGKKLKMFVA